MSTSNKAALDAIRADLLKRIPAQVQTEIGKAIDKAAAELVANAKALAPKDSGELAGSIRVEAGDDALSRRVIAGDADAPQATFIEFGTPHANAEPFFWPVVRLLRRRRDGQINRAVNKALKDFAG